MCTLTYLLDDIGYELFFNRDEQRIRVPAIPPTFNQSKNAIYPIDPQGGGTWIGVNQQGLTLALLNYYQASYSNNRHVVSRGQLILSLLHTKGDIIEQLKAMDLQVYQPFQLCIFPKGLSINKHKVHHVKWAGSKLLFLDVSLPITSSSIDIDEVFKIRRYIFNQIVSAKTPSSSQLKNFHFSTEPTAVHSVNMQRSDAQTVSISHIIVNEDITFNYFDNVVKKEHSTTFNRAKKIEFVS